MGPVWPGRSELAVLGDRQAAGPVWRRQVGVTSGLPGRTAGGREWTWGRARMSLQKPRKDGSHWGRGGGSGWTWGPSAGEVSTRRWARRGLSSGSRGWPLCAPRKPALGAGAAGGPAAPLASRAESVCRQRAHTAKAVSATSGHCGPERTVSWLRRCACVLSAHASQPTCLL